MTLVEVAAAFAERSVVYVVVGGMAVVAHGYLRGTEDLDLVIALDEDNCRRAMQALEALGFRPRAPVSAESFADAEQRLHWQRDNDMIVFTMWRERDSVLEQVDCFIDEPFDVVEAFREAHWKNSPSGVEIPFVDLERLRRMKRSAGRPLDMADLDELDLIHGPDDSDRSEERR